MKLDVPYYSQFNDVQNPEWQDKACSVACLKMALDFLQPHRVPDLNALMSEAFTHGTSMLEHGLVTETAAKHGIPHDVIVLMAHNYGVTAYREEFKSLTAKDGAMIESEYAPAMLEKGLQKITAMLETGSLVIASILPGLSSGSSNHTILLIGFEDNAGTLTGFYYHDPDSKTEARNSEFISLEDFLKYWRKLAIFVG